MSVSNYFTGANFHLKEALLHVELIGKINPLELLHNNVLRNILIDEHLCEVALC